MQNKKKRSPRFRRVKDPPRIRNFEVNYLPVIELIEEYRFIDSEQIRALIGGARTNLCLKLQKLYHNGYVERWLLKTGEGFGMRKIVYSLARKGVDVLREREPERLRKIYFPNRKRSEQFIEHELMISNLRVVLNLAAKQHGSAKLVDWIQSGIDGRFAELRKERLIPDAYFVIKTQKAELHYFLEADRGTMHLSRFYEKVHRYRKFFRKHRKKLPACFRVLTVTVNERHANNLRVTTIRGDPEGQGSERFWFCDEGSFVLDRPGVLLGPFCLLGLRGAEERRGGLFG